MNRVLIILPLFILVFETNSALFAAERFIQNGNAIIDNLTGLVWADKDAPERLNHGKAVKYCDNLNYAGFRDWRLPSVKELFSLTNDTLSSPAADPILGMKPDWYWSSSVNVSDSGWAWYVHFGYGSVGRDSRKYVIVNRVRCVRKGK